MTAAKTAPIPTITTTDALAAFCARAGAAP